MTYAFPRVTEVRRVDLEDEIDPTAVIALERRVGMAVDVDRCCVVLNVSAVDVPDESALGEFSDALQRMIRRGARLAIAGASPALQLVLERCAVDGVELYPTHRLALAAAGSTSRTTPPAAVDPDLVARSGQPTRLHPPSGAASAISLLPGGGPAATPSPGGGPPAPLGRHHDPDT